MNRKLIEVNIRGLKCDNPNCDWKDESIPFENYPKYVGHSCPKCGQNILTQECYDKMKAMTVFAKLFNIAHKIKPSEDGKYCNFKCYFNRDGSINKIEEVKDE